MITIKGMIWDPVVMIEEQNHHRQYLGKFFKIENIAAVEKCQSLSVNL